MADVKLLPCRCGGKPVLHENAEHWFRVACPECASSTIWRSRKKAIAKWNAVNDPAPVEPALASPGVTAGASVAANAPEPVEAAARLASLSAEVERLNEELDLREQEDCSTENDLLKAEATLAAERRAYSGTFDLLTTCFKILADEKKRAARMREALEPFVSHYEPWMERMADTDRMCVHPLHTMGDLRRARAALKETDR